MKTLILLLAFFISQICFSQSVPINNAPKKTWKILIQNTKSGDENFTMVGKALIENDYQIEKKDKEFLTIQTSPKNLKKLNASYYFNFSFKDSLIVLTGMSKLNISIDFGSISSESNYEMIINRGMKGSVAKESFNEMLLIATLISESELEFITD